MAATPTPMANDDAFLRQILRDFISGCHILHHHKVLDSFGHLSVRHPRYPDRFIMSRYIAPGTVSSERDLIEYYVSDAEPVNSNAPKGFSERCIHSELFKRFDEVKAVIHSHSDAVVPYTISGVPFRPCSHMAGFLSSTRSPVFDINDYYDPSDRKDMLVRNTRLGAALASYFGELGRPSHSVVLMRGHGFTVHGSSIMDVVLRAVYTQQNAGVQTVALITQAAYFGNGVHAAGGSGIVQQPPEVHFLSEEETEAAEDMIRASAARPWRLWLREVEASGLYVNTA